MMNETENEEDTEESRTYLEDDISVTSEEQLVSLNQGLTPSMSSNEDSLHSLTSFRRTRNTSRITDDVSHLNFEMLSAFRIVHSLSGTSNKGVNQPFLDPVDERDNTKYYSVISKPIWLNKIKSKLLQNRYDCISEVIRDLRLLLENCYRFYGTNHPNAKKAMKLETMLEQKLALLPKDLKEKTTLALTSPELAKSNTNHRGSHQKKKLSKPVPIQRAGNWKEDQSSVILSCVRQAKAQAARENRRLQMEEKRAEKWSNQIELIEWEENLIGTELAELRTMWEVPQMGHFFYLCQGALNLPEVSQFELERSFILPNSSSLLARIMTSLLSSPHLRTKLDKIPSMPYRIWQSRLKLKSQSWYKTYYNKNKCLLKVFEMTGVEPEYFRIMGDPNPFEIQQFHELSLKRRVWLIKALCDYCMQNHKSVLESLFEGQSLDQREYILGEDLESYTYIHFPQFCGQSLRVYKQRLDTSEPSLDLSVPIQTESVEEMPKIKEETKANDAKEEKIIKKDVRRKGKRGKSTRAAPAKTRAVEPEEKVLPPYFGLAADSVDSLRKLIDTLLIEDKPAEEEECLPEKKTRRGKVKKITKPEKEPVCKKILLERLNSLLMELDPWEAKLDQAEKKSRFKVKKEYEQQQRMQLGHQPEPGEEYWASESEAETVNNVPEEDSNCSTKLWQENLMISVPTENPTVPEEDFSNTNSPSTSFRKTHLRSCAKKILVNKPHIVADSTTDSEESEDSSSSDSYCNVSLSSRGRMRKTKNFVPLDGNKSNVRKKFLKIKDIEAELGVSKLNSTSDAQQQYHWETIRQKLIEPNVVNNLKEVESSQSELKVPENIRTNTKYNYKPIYQPHITSVMKAPDNETLKSVTSASVRPKEYLPTGLSPYKPKVIKGKNKVIRYMHFSKDNSTRVVKTIIERPGILKTTVAAKDPNSVIQPDNKLLNNGKVTSHPSVSSLPTVVASKNNSPKALPAHVTLNSKMLQQLSANHPLYIVQPGQPGQSKKILLKVVRSPGKGSLQATPISTSTLSTQPQLQNISFASQATGTPTNHQMPLLSSQECPVSHESPISTSTAQSEDTLTYTTTIHQYLTPQQPSLVVSPKINESLTTQYFSSAPILSNKELSINENGGVYPTTQISHPTYQTLDSFTNNMAGSALTTLSASQYYGQVNPSQIPLAPQMTVAPAVTHQSLVAEDCLSPNQIQNSLMQGNSLNTGFTPIVSSPNLLGLNLAHLTSSPPQLRQVVYQGSPTTVQLIGSPQLVGDSANQNLILCSPQMNGFLKTSNQGCSIMSNQGNVIFLTSPVAVALNSSVDDNHLMDNVTNLS